MVKNRHYTWRRVNGFTLPIHPLQVILWVVYLGLPVPSAIATFPMPLFPVTPCILVFFHILLFLLILYLSIFDPGIPINYLPREYNQENGHVIENSRCQICSHTVDHTTKHCKSCNKCISGFDHHCVWLNNCIGKKNYKAFFILVLLMALTSTASLITSITMLIFYFTDYQRLFKHENGETRIIFFTITSPIWLLITSIVLIMNIVLAVVTVNLLQFHIILIKRNLTTVAYLSMYSKKKTKANIGTKTISTNVTSRRQPIVNDLNKQTNQNSSTSNFTLDNKKSSLTPCENNKVTNFEVSQRPISRHPKGTRFPYRSTFGTMFNDNKQYLSSQRISPTRIVHKHSSIAIPQERHTLPTIFNGSSNF